MMRPTTSGGATDRLYAAAAPWVFAGVRIGARVLGASESELHERAGELPHATPPLLWLHGASAGEMIAAAHLVHALRSAGYAFTAGYTTTNHAGIAVARRTARAPDLVALAPWDAPRWVARALNRWQPRALFLVETELWPRLVLEAHSRRIPVFSVSARMYPRDEGRYRLVRPFIAPTLRRLSLVMAQNETERARFVRLGAAMNHCMVAGDLKQATGNPDPAIGAQLRAELGLTARDRLIVCGSVHDDEIPLLLSALAQLGAAGVRFLIAPRHTSAVRHLIDAARGYGWRVCRRNHEGTRVGRSATPHASRADALTTDWQVLVLDTHGELPTAYASATIAVVGGTFGRHGGHNLLEPVRAGAPVLFGPHTDHVAGDAMRLIARTPEARVCSADDLTARLGAWLSDDERRRDVYIQQREVLPDGVGIAKHYVAVLSPWLREMGLERA